MSRVLLVLKEVRDIPWYVNWWRLPLYPNKEGYVSMTQVDPTFSERKPWWAHIDYFDGRDDWSFPYAARVTEDRELEVWELSRTFIDHRQFFLDILAAAPPGSPRPNPHWRGLTTKCNLVHPDDWNK